MTEKHRVTPACSGVLALYFLFRGNVPGLRGAARTERLEFPLAGGKLEAAAVKGERNQI